MDCATNSLLGIQRRDQSKESPAHERPTSSNKNPIRAHKSHSKRDISWGVPPETADKLLAGSSDNKASPTSNTTLVVSAFRGLINLPAKEVPRPGKNSWNTASASRPVGLVPLPFRPPRRSLPQITRHHLLNPQNFSVPLPSSKRRWLSPSLRSIVRPMALFLCPLLFIVTTSAVIIIDPGRCLGNGVVRILVPLTVSSVLLGSATPEILIVWWGFFFLPSLSVCRGS